MNYQEERRSWSLAVASSRAESELVIEARCRSPEKNVCKILMTAAVCPCFHHRHGSEATVCQQVSGTETPGLTLGGSMHVKRQSERSRNNSKSHTQRTYLSNYFQVIRSAEDEVQMLLPHVKETEQFMQLFGREYLKLDVSLQRSQV